MARPKLLRAEKRSEIVFLKLRPSERKALDVLSRARRKAENPSWTISSLIREGVLLFLQQERRRTARSEKTSKVA